MENLITVLESLKNRDFVLKTKRVGISFRDVINHVTNARNKGMKDFQIAMTLAIVIGNKEIDILKILEGTDPATAGFGIYTPYYA